MRKALVFLGVLGLAACGGRVIPIPTSGDAGGDAKSAPSFGIRTPASPDGVHQCPLPAEAASRWLAFDSDRGGNRDIYAVRADGSAMVRLTSAASTERDPAFSHDGTKLAFASNISGVMQIYALDLATNTATQLTSSNAGADQPSWSFGDSQIAFHTGTSIAVMSSNGSNPKVLATGPYDAAGYEYPSFSLDGSEILCDRHNEIDAYPVDGSPFRYVVHNTTQVLETPALSPDGATIAYRTQCTPEGELYVAPYASESLICQTTPTVSDFMMFARRPAWGPSDAIAFERFPRVENDGGPQVSTATIAVIVGTATGETPCDLVGAPGDNRNPAWAPAGAVLTAN